MTKLDLPVIPQHVAIIMDGNLVSFVTEPRPTCSFAYY